MPLRTLDQGDSSERRGSGDDIALPPGLKVLLTHDWLLNWAGSERVLEQILKVVPTADVVSAIVDPALVRKHLSHVRVRGLWLNLIPGARRHYQWLLPLEALAFRMIDSSGYDLVVSSSHALAKTVSPGRRGIHLCYCYSPPRYLWDLHDVYMAGASRRRRIAMALGRKLMQSIDLGSARRVTHFLSLSNYVAKRIDRVYKRRARVVYPPVSPKMADVSKGSVRRENFLLYLGRLVPYKRVDLIVNAARIHGVRTIIAGGGPEYTRLRALAGRNVEFLGCVSEEEAARLLDTCAAFVFCAEEDFGIAPLEANAHGAPVVALRAGGILETMLEGKTAVFFDEPNERSLCGAISVALSRSWDEDALRANAARFSPAAFRVGFAQALLAAISGVTW